MNAASTTRIDLFPLVALRSELGQSQPVPSHSSAIGMQSHDLENLGRCNRCVTSNPLIAAEFNAHHRLAAAKRRQMRGFFPITAILGGFAVAMWTIAPASPGLKVRDAVAVPVPGAPNTVMVTMTIENPGAPDRLLDVRSNVAKVAVLKAPDTAGVPIPAGGAPSLVMEAGHIMLMGLANVPIEGGELPMILQFEQAGEIAQNALVVSAAMRHEILDVSEEKPVPRVEVSVDPVDDGWDVKLVTENFRFAEDLVGGPHEPGVGHAHLYVQGAKIGRVFGGAARIGPLPKGTHTVRVTLNTNDHRAYYYAGKAIEATARIAVK